MLEVYECLSDLAHGLQENRSMIGVGYDFLAVFGFVIKLLVWRLFKRKILNPFHRNNKEFCSEFSARIIVSSGVHGFEKVDPPSVSPGDLRNMLITNPLFRRIPEPWK
jgi:hypothetical protein